MENLRIQEIQITNLFGELNYDITLPPENPISIITAPNGRGKTTILNLISFMFDPSYQRFLAIRTVPFSTFSCTLSNGNIVELERTNLVFIAEPTTNKNSSMFIDKTTNMIRSVFEDYDFQFAIYKGKKKVAGPLYLSKEYLEAGNIDPHELLFDEEEIDDYIFNFRTQRSMGLRFKYVSMQINNILHEAKCDINVNYIGADRIQPLIYPRREQHYDDAPKSISPLEKASKDISVQIKAANDKYKDAVSQAKDNLPEMFIEDVGGDLTSTEFIEGWCAYRQKLIKFQEIGLITPSKDFTHNKNIPKIYDHGKGPFLSTYLQAFQDTTKPLETIYEQLNLFKRIFDERNAITGKEVSFSSGGVQIKVGDREICLDALSSGEKHDFIMFYNLILGEKTGGVVLIDEPEISLHIEWQRTYLDKLIEICKMNGLQAIIATHSPSIVSSHYAFVADKGESHG